MKPIEIKSRELLNTFVGWQEHSQFLQSWEWGEFQEKVSGKVWRIGVEDNGKLIASAKIIKKELPLKKSYFYCARGPIIAEGNREEVTEKLLDEIARVAKEEGVMFLRFDPLFELQAYKKYHAVKTLDIQPGQTSILDLEKTEEELLGGMHTKTRYNIRLAEKKGVKITEGSIADFEGFWTLLDQTSGRDKFRPHGRSYYKAMLEINNDFIKLFFAEYEGKKIATGIFSYFGDTFTYLHGGSANEMRNIMAPFALQWHCIKLAKSLGCKYYDFHGISDEKWPGVTRFKKGFGGSAVNYPGTFDLSYDDGWYAIYKMIRKARRTF